MISAERQVLNLIAAYAERLDARDIEGVADLFEHATISTDGGGEIRGRAGVMQMFASRASDDAAGPPSVRRRQTKHVTTNVILEIDDGERTARARSVYVVIAENDDGELRIMTAGRYHDEFELIDGQWRFSARRYIQDLAPVRF